MSNIEGLIDGLIRVSSFEKIGSYIYLFPLRESGVDASLKRACPSFEVCGMDWVFAVDGSKISSAYHDLGFITKTIFKKWFQESGGDFAMETLYKAAVFNMISRADHVQALPLYDEDDVSIAVPILEIFLDDMSVSQPYTTSLILCDPVLSALHQTIGDFYLIPRYRDRFFAISAEDLSFQGRTVQESLCKMLAKPKFEKIPSSEVLSSHILFADDDELCVYV